MSKKFTWDAWDFDCEGDAYIIAKSECPEKENVSDYIVKKDNLHLNCKNGMVVEQGICKFQVRSDWENCEGEQLGGYYVIQGAEHTSRISGWFEVWIVRKGSWY